MAVASVQRTLRAREASLRFLGTILLFVLLLKTAYLLPGVFKPLKGLETATSVAVTKIIEIGGFEVDRIDTLLVHPSGFACRIYYRCTGLIQVLLLAVGLLALPGPAARKTPWIALGGLLVLGVNIARVAAVYIVGARFPDAFGFVHGVLGELLMVGVVVAVWAGWLFVWRESSSASSPSG
jgi:exosortase/archaeosortase family protein